MSEYIKLPDDTTPVILVGDVIEQLRRLPPMCIDVIVTSPPYYKQREYGLKGEVGQEKTSNEYIEKMVSIGDELRRVLKNTGSYFLNIGDKFEGKKQQLIQIKA